MRLESLVPPPGIFDLQSADVHLAALVNELMQDDKDAIEPTLLEDAIQQRAKTVLRDWKLLEGHFVETEISFEYWSLQDSDDDSDSEEYYADNVATGVFDDNDSPWIDHLGRWCGVGSLDPDAYKRLPIL